MPMPTEKSQLRSRIADRLSEWGQSQRATASGDICAQLGPRITSSTTILAFWPLTRIEPDIRPALEAAQSNGASICLPRTDGTALHPHRVDDFGSLKRSDFGVREPVAGVHPECALVEIDVVLVPGVAFTRDGFRLGRGGGHYDRFLARLRPDVTTIGIAFSPQRVDTLPTEPHDLPVAHLICDRP